MAATLRPGGWLVLDFLNAAQVRAHVGGVAGALEPGERGSRLRRYLSPDQRHVIKEIHLADGRQFKERVRLFDAAELEAMLARGGRRRAVPVRRLPGRAARTTARRARC